MSGNLGGRAAELLCEVLVGDRDQEDLEVQALVESDPEFRRELGAMLLTVSSLEATADLERAVLGECPLPREPLESSSSSGEQASGVAPGEDEVEGILRALIAEEDAALAAAPGGRRSRLFLLLPLVAAALLVGLFVFGPDRGGVAEPPRDPQPGLLLGEGDIEPLAPTGEVADFSTFRWQHELEPGQRFEVRVLDAESGRELMTSEQVETNHWSPATAQLDGWPRAIDWEVSVVSVMNEIERTSARVRATRRP